MYNVIGKLTLGLVCALLIGTTCSLSNYVRSENRWDVFSLNGYGGDKAMRIPGVLLLVGLLSGCAALPGVIVSGAGMAGSMPILGHIGTGYSVLCRGYRFLKGENLEEQIQNDYDQVVEFFAGKTVVRRDGSADGAEDVTHG